MNNIERVENKDICQLCGGKCCKACGCNYASTDFENLSFNSMFEILEKGNISIIASLDFQYTANGIPFAAPTLYLRERNINSDVIDLVSIASRCSSLTDTGCPYSLDKRPSGGAALTPNYPDVCHSHEMQEAIYASWKPYQNTLRKLVKRLTGKSVEEEIKRCVEELYYKLFTKDFNEYDSKTSILMYSDMLYDFSMAFPSEIAKAKSRALASKNLALRLTKS